MSRLRFSSVDQSHSANIVKQLRSLTDLPVSTILNHLNSGLPLVEITPFTTTWEDDRVKLVKIAKAIESGDLPFKVTEVYEDGSEADVSPTMLRNLIQHFREIELETQRDTMLELGDIEIPSQFTPVDDDWTQ
ncbi:hypothetical protein Pan181_38340 [Aeoliella mucimassa]|uniref:Uncharacterized protein n=1 Tax=Aeoliella mucimassa TaxID=2527972 RepID=A0A518ASC8_9BACT|nr:hypothetical protein Pan181_38340 [Aeoliella mucimassa]